MSARFLWAAAIILGLGALFTVGVDSQRLMSLRIPLEHGVPNQIAGFHGRDVELSKAERRVAGMSSYVMRVYSPTGKENDQIAAEFSVYVGYYPEQLRGRTIHSPKNCLPGAGWQALTSNPVAVNTAIGNVEVNRYVLQRGDERAIVLYWYQGRGRVEASEYRVKWNLLKDAALRRRSDEALVRVVVPALGSELEATRTAHAIATLLVPAVDRALPKG